MLNLKSTIYFSQIINSLPSHDPCHVRANVQNLPGSTLCQLELCLDFADCGLESGVIVVPAYIHLVSLVVPVEVEDEDLRDFHRVVLILKSASDIGYNTERDGYDPIWLYQQQ